MGSHDYASPLPMPGSLVNNAGCFLGYLVLALGFAMPGHQQVRLISSRAS